MNRFPIEVRSYPAGTTSTAPDGYRRVVGDSDHRWTILHHHFPGLRRFLTSSSLLINAYPAALGLAGRMPLVPHALHRPTFVRGLASAVQEARPVVLAAQPLAGADHLLFAADAERELPSEILWVTGGYPLPRSLEAVVRRRLAERESRLSVLFSYGVAEVGHTCFAADRRDAAGRPIYRCLIPGLQVDSVEERSAGVGEESYLVHPNGRRANTGDRLEAVADGWRIHSGPKRLAPQVQAELERWDEARWRRRTGYLRFAGSASHRTHFQLRDTIEMAVDRNEVTYHDFADRYGGTFQVKPRWTADRATT